MSRNAVEALIGKAMLDDNFRQQFLADPQGAAHSQGYHLTDQQLDAIRAAIDTLREVGDRLSELLSAPGAASEFVDIHVH